MRRLIAAAMLVSGLAVSAFGQRGGAHSGVVFSGHSAVGAGSRWSAGSPFSYGTTRPVAHPGTASGLPVFRAGTGSGYRRPIYGGAGRFHSPHVGVPYGLYGYSVGYSDWNGQDYPEAPNLSPDGGSGHGDAPSAPPSGLPDTDPGLGNDSAAYAGPTVQGSAYREAYEQPRPVPAPPPANEAATLIFKDGRTPEQIHNYLLSRTVVHVWDGRPHDVPLEQLDLQATMQANKDVGVPFQLLGVVP